MKKSCYWPYRDDEGTIAPGTMYQYAIAGAILSELMLRQRIAVDESARKKRAEVIDRSPTDAPLLDECLEKMAASKAEKGLDHWVSKFARRQEPEAPRRRTPV